MNRNLLRLGFILIFISFGTGLVIPLLTNPHLGVSAHLNALLGGIILAVVGLTDRSLRLTAGIRRIMCWSWGYAAYMNWLATLLGGVWGTSKFTPVAGAGFAGSVWQETFMAGLLASLVIAAFIAVAITVFGLRGADETV